MTKCKDDVVFNIVQGPAYKEPTPDGYTINDAYNEFQGYAGLKLADKDILRTMIYAARVYGHRAHYATIVDFIEWCHKIAGKQSVSESDWRPYKEIIETVFDPKISRRENIINISAEIMKN